MPINKNSYWADKSKHLENFNDVQRNTPLLKKSKLFFWRNKITVSNKSASIKKIKWIYIFFGALFSFLLLLGLLSINFKMAPYLGGFWAQIKDIFKFDSTDGGSGSLLVGNLWEISFRAILETIKITIIGTLLGVLLAIPTSFLSSRNITKKFINVPIRGIMAFFRTLPPLVYALIFSSGMSPTFAASMTLMFFTWATMNKLMYEEIENTSTDAYHALVSSGMSKASAFKQTIWKAVMPKFISLSIYSFEINVRISAILGIIGGLAGIGSIYAGYIQNSSWTKIGVPIVMLFITILILESISMLLRVFVFEKRNKPINGEALDQYTSERNYKLFVLNEKYNNKLKRAKNKKEIIKLNRWYKNKKQKIIAKYPSVDKKTKNLSFQQSFKDISIKYDKKTKRIISYYERKIKNSKSKSKKLKYEIALKQYILENKQLQKREEAICQNALNSSKKVLFTYKYSTKDWIIKGSIGVIFFALVIWSSIAMHWSMTNAHEFKTNLSYIFKPDFSMFGTAFKETSVALIVAFMATIFGGIFAFIFGMLASKKISGKYISPIFQGLIILIRIIPAFMIAVIIFPAFMDGTFVAVLALGIHSIGMLGKLIREQFDHIDLGPGQSIRAAGGKTSDVIRYAYLPQVAPKAISVIIYRLEINLKSITEVGFIMQGISEFGWNLQLSISTGKTIPSFYAKAYSYIWSLIIFVLIVEFLSNVIRSYILTGRLPKWMYAIKKIVRRKIIVNDAMFLEKIKYNTKDMSGSEIEIYSKLERQSAIDRGLLLSIKDEKIYKDFISNNELIYKLKNKKQFGLISKEEEKLLEKAIIDKKKYIKAIKIWRNKNKIKINKNIKHYQNKYKQAKKQAQIDAQKVFIKKQKAIKDEALKYDKLIHNLKQEQKQFNNLTTPNVKLKNKMLISQTKRSKRKAIILIKKKPIHNFI